MEARRDEEEEEKEEEIEEEKEEEEKDESQEEEKQLQKEEQNLEHPKNDNINKINQEQEKLTDNSKDQSPLTSPKKEVELQNHEDEEQEQEQDSEATSTYILKYTRKPDELKELSTETGLKKSENCLFMLNIKLIKSDSISIINQMDDLNIKETPKEPENFLVFCCHEIAAIYFDEIYERIYTLKDLAKENKYFKVFESPEEAKNVIDETIRTNEKNAKKIFIAFKDKELKLHMKLSFFDKEKEIVLNIPKKKLTDNDKVNLLPEFLKEIQDKMNHLNEEDKKLKSKKAAHINRNKEITNYINNSKIYGNDSSDKKDKINSININNDNNKDIKINEFNGEQINADSNNSLTKISNNININTNIKNDNNNSINNGGVSIHKKGKKSNKSNKKKHLKPEENFF
jgi:hypothetical protein